jgi:hypothetical protein
MTRLEPVLVRIPPEIARAIRDLSRRTRVPIAAYQREAMADLLWKYDALPTPPGSDGDTRGAA